MDVGVDSSWLLALLLGSVRAAAWLTLCPPFNARGVPSQVKALLSVAIALPMAPGMADQIPDDLSTSGLLVSVVEQVVVGSALGFLTMVLFAAVQSAGNLVDLFGGFSLAFSFDPFSNTGNAVFGRIYNLTSIALLFGTEAHQIVLRGFTRSYQAVPLDGTMSFEAFSRMLTTGLGQMFIAALQIAGPLIAVLFAADVALGLLTRAAPALNPFSLGFPAKILLTMLIAGSALTLLPGAIASLTDKAVKAVLTVVGAD